MSLIPWNTDFRISKRLTWIAISGLPPQLWLPNTFSSIAKHWGTVMIADDCNKRQFNRTTKRVCILMDKLDFIRETVLVPVNKEIIPVRVFETDEDVDSLINGYYFDSSFDEEDYSNNGDNEQGDDNYFEHGENSEGDDAIHSEYQHEGIHGDDCKGDFSGEESHVASHSNVASGINPNMEKENGYNSPIIHTVGQIEEGSTSKDTHEVKDIPIADSQVRSSHVPAFCPTKPTLPFSVSTSYNNKSYGKNNAHSKAHNKAQKPLPQQKSPSRPGSPQLSRNTTDSSTSKRSRSVPIIHHHTKIPNTKRKKRFTSLRLIDPLNGVRGYVTQPRKSRQTTRNTNTQPLQPTLTSCDSDGISDSLSKIQRCNIRILSNVDQDMNSDSNEVASILQVGNQIGFKMDGKDSDVEREDHKRSWLKRLCSENKVNFMGIQETMTGIEWKVWWYPCGLGYILVHDSIKGQGFLALLGRWRNNDASCLMVIVYAPQDHRDKQLLWKNLTRLIDNHNDFSIIFGDFNEVRSEVERLGTLFDRRSAATFNEFIHTSGLCDLQMGDHNEFPALFQDSWTLPVTGLQTRGSTSASGLPAVAFKIKLQRLKRSIRHWRSIVKHSETKMCLDLRNKVDTLDNKAELTSLSPTEVEERNNSIKLLANFECRKVKDLKQIAKLKWAAKGDENSHFFHGIINSRRHRSRINGLNIHGNWITEPLVIKNHVYNSFCDRFKEENPSRPLFSSNLFKQLSLEDSHSLDCSFTIEEIKAAVWDCGSCKAPGPDGFTFKFFKKHWDTLKHDIVSYVKEFEDSALIPRGCNSSFITLVPKVDDPLVVSDFRPISLIGSQYKIIAKILANRLSRVVSSVVGDVQMAYIKGRQIIDGPLMVDEIIAWAKKYKKRVMFLKVDFEKAFDSLNWSFLFCVLEQMGFSSKWRTWIHSCLDSVFASVLVNGSPTKEFKIQRGLRQGDPLSPFLFILAIEALNVALLEATNKNIFCGIKVGKDKIHISHLQFADDALIMGEWSRDNAKNLSRILTCFHLAFGLKVNFNKSKLFGVGISTVDLHSLASFIGCLASQLPFTYLGLSISANMSRCFNWNPLIERFHKRLSKWKSKTLSIGGRLTLTKSILGSLGVYYFSTFKAPKKKKVICPRDQGGLGIDGLGTCNQAMLVKWWWRFHTENQAIWRKVICSIHGPLGGLDDNSSLRPNSGPWYHIAKIKDDLLKVNINLDNIFKIKLGNGQSTSFWNDIWIGDTPLVASFPRLYHVTRHSIQSTGNGSMSPYFPPGLIFQWVWRREPRPGPETEELISLVSLLSNLYLSNVEDRWECTIDASRRFTVKGMRSFITSMSHSVSSTVTRWNKVVPLKININTWRVLNGRMATRANLDRRGIDLDFVRCPICDDVETKRTCLLIASLRETHG
ncbi:putative RNA-directed DNA polymerase [Tanacetum coccineum]